MGMQNGPQRTQRKCISTDTWLPDATNPCLTPCSISAICSSLSFIGHESKDKPPFLLASTPKYPRILQNTSCNPFFQPGKGQWS